ncbi:MAG: tyrosine-type recombinase/integrase [Clostridia bacterium]|nr:tyrosine-type recombinase/integrase [Clostridia bacterium]
MKPNLNSDAAESYDTALKQEHYISRNCETAPFFLTDSDLLLYLDYLKSHCRSENTLNKYSRDLHAFRKYLGNDTCVTVERLYRYRTYLEKEYTFGKNGSRHLSWSSINSQLTAINSLFSFLHRKDLSVELFSVQKKSYLDKLLTLEDINILIKTAERLGKYRLALIIFTLTSTGIRISELSSITVESLISTDVTVENKGKKRSVLLPSNLCKALISYCRCEKIRSGPVFKTKSGKPLDRSNIWKELKALAEIAGIPSEKVFPHNFRHFFAKNYYSIEGDIAGLSNLLGHSSINTTMIYVKESRDDAIKKVEHAGRALISPSFYCRS